MEAGRTCPDSTVPPKKPTNAPKKPASERARRPSARKRPTDPGLRTAEPTRYDPAVVNDPSAALAGLSRETTIVLDKDGRFFHDGRPVDHPGIVRAFHRWIDRAEDGRFVLRNAINWAYIKVAGTPLFVRSVRLCGARPVTHVYLSLSDGSEEELRYDTLRQDKDGVFYADARMGTMAARFDKHAALGLSPVVGEDDDGPFLEVVGRKLRPATVEDASVVVSPSEGMHTRPPPPVDPLAMTLPPPDRR